MMLITFCDIQGLVHHKLCHQGQNMNQIFHGTVLQCLQDRVCWKLPHKLLPVPHFCTLTTYCAQLHCMSGSSCQAQHLSGSLPVLPYLTPTHLLPVPHAEDTLKGKRHKDIAEMQLNLVTRGLSKTDHWKHCTQAGSSHFEVC